MWDPELAAWIVGSLIPPINVGVGLVYLVRRSNVRQVAPPTAGVDDHTEAEDEALDNLRERYSRGELTDEEFERKLEGIVGTEDRETAGVHARDTAESVESVPERER